MDLGVTAVMLPELDFPDQVRLCASLGVRFYQIRTRRIPTEQLSAPYSCWGNHRFDLTPERLLSEGPALAAQLRAAGMRPWGTLPKVDAGFPDEHIIMHLEGAVASEAGRMRLSPPAPPPGTFDAAAWLRGVIERYRHIVETLSRPRGIRILIETHAGGVASSPGLAWVLVQEFDPRDIGVIFDLGNFAREGEVAPALAVSLLRDWIDCVHVGGSRRRTAGSDSQGSRLLEHEQCPPSESDLHVPTWIAALRAAGIDPPLIVEDFSAGGSGPDRLRRDVQFLSALPGVEGSPV
jgi:sugar phosphate isomerase/epimerase